MPSSIPALRFAWLRPKGGMRLVALPLSKGKVRHVFAPVGRHLAAWEPFEPTATELEALVRDLARLRVADPKKLLNFAARWGPFGGLTTVEPGALGHEAAELEEGALACLVEPLETVTLALLEYHTALSLHAGMGQLRRWRTHWRLELEIPEGAVLPRAAAYPRPPLFYLDKEGTFVSTDIVKASTENEARAAWVRLLIATRRNHWETTEEETFGWRVTSPLGAGWRLLVDSVVEATAARLCENCHRPFLPMRTNRKRRTHPPRFCSDSCRVTAARRRARESKKAPRRGRGRKKA